MKKPVVAFKPGPPPTMRGVKDFISLWGQYDWDWGIVLAASSVENTSGAIAIHCGGERRTSLTEAIQSVDYERVVFAFCLKGVPWTVILSAVGRRGDHTGPAQRLGASLFEALGCEVICFGRSQVTWHSPSASAETRVWNRSLTEPEPAAVEELDAWFASKDAFVPVFQSCSDGMCEWLEVASLSPEHVERVDVVFAGKGVQPRRKQGKQR